MAAKKEKREGGKRKKRYDGNKVSLSAQITEEASKALTWIVNHTNGTPAGVVVSQALILYQATLEADAILKRMARSGIDPSAPTSGTLPSAQHPQLPTKDAHAAQAVSVLAPGQPGRTG